MQTNFFNRPVKMETPKAASLIKVNIVCRPTRRQTEPAINEVLTAVKNSMVKAGLK